MKLVVIVPTFGRKAQVARLLRELEAQTQAAGPRYCLGSG